MLVPLLFLLPRGDGMRPSPSTAALQTEEDAASEAIADAAVNEVVATGILPLAVCVQSGHRVGELCCSFPCISMFFDPSLCRMPMQMVTRHWRRHCSAHKTTRERESVCQDVLGDKKWQSHLFSRIVSVL